MEDDQLNSMPAVDWRVTAAAMYLIDHPFLSGFDIYRELGRRFGLNAAQCHEAMWMRDDLRFGWSPRRRRL